MDRNFDTMQIVVVIVVALRKESVDRNEWIKAQYPGCRLSLSARRVWIEIVTRYRPTPKPVVALRKESVDRNNIRIAPIDSIIGRSPQGECG